MRAQAMCILEKVTASFSRTGAHMDDYVEVFTATDITFAHLMKANLEAAGIPAQISNENLQGALCVDGMVPGVLVPKSREQEARQIVEDFRQASLPDDDEQQQEAEQ